MRGSWGDKVGGRGETPVFSCGPFPGAVPGAENPWALKSTLPGFSLVLSQPFIMIYSHKKTLKDAVPSLGWTRF